MSVPSSRLIAALIALSIIAATSCALYQRDKTIRTEQMTAQYDLGYYKAQTEMLNAVMDAGRTSTRKFRDETVKNRALSDVDLDRRAVSLGIMCHGSDC